jgi:hypothetical protein
LVADEPEPVDRLEMVAGRRFAAAESVVGHEVAAEGANRRPRCGDRGSGVQRG